MGIENVYNALNGTILTNTKHITLMEVNKKFIKHNTSNKNVL